MNLYIFNEIRLGAVYGIGTYIRELTAALKNSDIKVCVVNLNSDKPQIMSEETDGILNFYFPSPVQWTKDLQEQWDLYHHNIVYLLQLQIKDKKDLIFHLNYNQKGKLAEELKKTFDCRVVVTIHYTQWALNLLGNLARFRQIRNKPEQEKNEFEKSVYSIDDYEQKLYQTVDRVISLSEYTSTILCNDYHLNPNKITTIPNGLSDRKTNTDQKTLHSKWGLNPDEKIILFVGRLDNIKGVEYLIRAFREVLKVIPDSRLIIAGNGSFNLYMKEAKDICTRVTFTGLLDKEELYELYNIADIGVMPSFHEQCSYVAIEMMMHGVPLIASTSTGLCEMIEDGVSGLHIPVVEYPDKVEIDSLLLSKKILFLLQNPEEAKRLGENARKRYEEVYSSEIFRKNVLKFYQKMISEI